MLIKSQIVPAAQERLGTDIGKWAEKELYGLQEEVKPFSHLFADMLMMICLKDPLLSLDRQQFFLSKLQSNN